MIQFVVNAWLSLVGGLGGQEDQSCKLIIYPQSAHYAQLGTKAASSDKSARLYDHSAKLNGDLPRIAYTGGQVTHHPTKMTVENLATWEFDLDTKPWSAIATKPFKRWLLVREDDSYHELWGIAQVARSSRSSDQDKFAEKYRVELEERGHVVDPNLFYSRFSAPIPHGVVELESDSDEFNVHRILVDGVVVRYVEDIRRRKILALAISRMLTIDNRFCGTRMCI